MLSLLARLFIRNHKQYTQPDVRRAYGTLCTAFTIALNLVLVVAKLITAYLSRSFAIHADAINNLSDVGSSVLLLLAFAFAGMKPRPDRPFGHGRIEYVAGFVVAMFIIICGFEIGKNAISEILHPTPIVFSWLAVGVLVGSIAMKFYMGFYSTRIARKIESEALHATGLDCMSDTLSTFATLIGVLIFQFTPAHLNLDGWLGLFVSLLILKAGYDAAKETLQQLLGRKPSPRLVSQIKDICRSHPEVIGLHDLVVHDYGPGRLHVSVHCEVPGNKDIFQLHEAMDSIMNELDETIGCISVIHMDPICTDDSRVGAMRKQLEEAVKELGPEVRIHDFRLVAKAHKNSVLFDCVIPLNGKMDDEEAHEKVKAIVLRLWPTCTPIFHIDHPFA